MNDNSLSPMTGLDSLRERQVQAWQRGERLLVESLISNSASQLSENVMLALICAEVTLRRERGEVCGPEEYVQRFPILSDALQRIFTPHNAIESPSVETHSIIGVHVQAPRELRPTIRGAFDLHGNLFEWTHDWYGAYGGSAVTDALGAKEGSDRMCRGGSWSFDAAFCRPASRYSFGPEDRAGDVGFRIALRPSGVPRSSEQGQEK